MIFYIYQDLNASFRDTHISRQDMVNASSIEMGPKKVKMQNSSSENESSSDIIDESNSNSNKNDNNSNNNGDDNNKNHVDNVTNISDKEDHINRTSAYGSEGKSHQPKYAPMESICNVIHPKYCEMIFTAVSLGAIGISSFAMIVFCIIANSMTYTASNGNF